MSNASPQPSTAPGRQAAIPPPPESELRTAPPRGRSRGNTLVPNDGGGGLAATSTLASLGESGKGRAARQGSVGVVPGPRGDPSGPSSDTREGTTSSTTGALARPIYHEESSEGSEENTSKRATSTSRRSPGPGAKKPKGDVRSAPTEGPAAQKRRIAEVGGAQLPQQPSRNRGARGDDRTSSHSIDCLRRRDIPAAPRASTHASSSPSRTRVTANRGAAPSTSRASRNPFLNSNEIAVGAGSGAARNNKTAAERTSSAARRAENDADQATPQRSGRRQRGPPVVYTLSDSTDGDSSSTSNSIRASSGGASGVRSTSRKQARSRSAQRSARSSDADSDENYDDVSDSSVSSYDSRLPSTASRDRNPRDGAAGAHGGRRAQAGPSSAPRVARRGAPQASGNSDVNDSSDDSSSTSSNSTVPPPRHGLQGGGYESGDDGSFNSATSTSSTSPRTASIAASSISRSDSATRERLAEFNRTQTRAQAWLSGQRSSRTTAADDDVRTASTTGIRNMSDVHKDELVTDLGDRALAAKPDSKANLNFRFFLHLIKKGGGDPPSKFHIREGSAVYANPSQKIVPDIREHLEKREQVVAIASRLPGATLLACAQGKFGSDTPESLGRAVLLRHMSMRVSEKDIMAEEEANTLGALNATAITARDVGRANNLNPPILWRDMSPHAGTTRDALAAMQTVLSTVLHFPNGDPSSKSGVQGVINDLIGALPTLSSQLDKRADHLYQFMVCENALTSCMELLSRQSVHGYYPVHLLVDLNELGKASAARLKDTNTTKRHTYVNAILAAEATSQPRPPALPGRDAPSGGSRPKESDRSGDRSRDRDLDRGAHRDRSRDRAYDRSGDREQQRGSAPGVIGTSGNGALGLSVSNMSLKKALSMSRTPLPTDNAGKSICFGFHSGSQKGCRNATASTPCPYAHALNDVDARKTSTWFKDISESARKGSNSV